MDARLTAQSGGLTALADRKVLAVMARPLIPGRVKTRLAATIGAEAALDVYRRLLDDTLTAAEGVEAAATLVLAVAPLAPDPLSCGDARLGRPIDDGRAVRWRTLTQRGESLGERLAALFADLFERGAGVVVALGSDSPRLPSAYLGQALASAGEDRLVVGPATDGGYYAIGLDRSTWRRHRPAIERLLLESPMGTPSLLSWTQARAGAIGLAVHQLPLWLDVDDASGLAVMDRLTGRVAPRVGLAGDGRLREVYLHVTNRCGGSCPHCYNHAVHAAPSAGEELTTQQWRRTIDECVELGATSFVFLGGDPLLRDDLCALIGHVTGARGRRARLFFNSPVTPRLAAELALAGHGALRPLVSIDGPEEIHDELRGPGNHRAAFQSVAALRSAGLEPLANTVLLRPTLAGLPALARELKRAGVTRLHLILPHPRGGLAENLELLPTGAEMLVALRRLLAVAAEIDLTVDNLTAWRRRLTGRQDFCAAGCRDLAVDPHGGVYACPITINDPAFRAGDLRRQTLHDVWRSSPGLRLLRAAAARDRVECAACPVVDACGGECWMQAHYAARERGLPAGPAAPFPYCDLIRPVFEELLAERPVQRVAAGVGAGGGQAAAGADAYTLFDCI